MSAGSKLAIYTRRKTVREDRDTVMHVVRSYVEGITFLKQNKNFSQKVLAKYFRTRDPEYLDGAYAIFKEDFLASPYPITAAAAAHSGGAQAPRQSHAFLRFTSMDNFGRWRSDFRKLVEQLLQPDVPGRAVVDLLKPEEDDYFVLKPKRSAFFRRTLRSCSGISASPA